MNAIPLIKGNTPQEINTSIISLKKALAALEGTDKDVQNKIKQINELINGINSQITDLQPVDTVTSGDMHSVTSNAVAQSISTATDFSRQGAYCETDGTTQAKVASMKDFVLSTGVSFPITFKNENTYNGKVTLNINNTGAKDVYLNGSITSSTNKLIRAGTYLCWYSGSVYYIDIGWEVYRSRQSQIAGRASDLQAFSCTTASATVAKTVGHFAYSLSTRSEILVYFSNTNTATNPTLNVNGTGAKAIRIFGVQPNSTNNLLVAGTYRGFYDGTYWNLEPYGVTNEVASNNMQSVTSGAVSKVTKEWTDITSQVTLTITSNAGGVSIETSKTKIYMCGNLLHFQIYCNCNGNLIVEGADFCKIVISSSLFTLPNLLSRTYYPSFYGSGLTVVGLNVYDGDNGILTARLTRKATGLMDDFSFAGIVACLPS